MLRDPVARAFSHYSNNVRDGVEPRSFEDAIASEIDEGDFDWWTSYVGLGRYPAQISNVRKHFGNQTHIVLLADLLTEPRSVINRLCAFLDIDPAPLDGVPFPKTNAYSGPAIVNRGATALKSGHPKTRAKASLLNPPAAGHTPQCCDPTPSRAFHQQRTRDFGRYSHPTSVPSRRNFDDRCHGQR